MPKSRQHKASAVGETISPSNKQDRIEKLLKIQLETFPQKELSPEEIERWIRDLSGYRMEAIEYAFEEHRTLAMFFPVPAQILDIVKTWEPPQKLHPACSTECKQRHGKGYGWADVWKLWKLHGAKRTELNRALNTDDWEQLMRQVDKERGGSPEWRTA